MFARIAAFEFRYQVRSALFIASAALFFLAAFVDMGVSKMVQDAGGTILYNSPHSIIRTHILASLLFIFIGAAFISNVIVRDDQTGFGPIVRATGIGKFDYLFGRLTGALAAGVLIMAAATLGSWLGTLVPFGNQAMMGPSHASGYLYGFFYVALPNALIVSAILFALATATRSTGGTFIGVILLLIFYLFAQRLAQNMTGMDDLRALLDPLGMSPWVAATRYLTAAEINAGVVPVTQAMIQGKVLWVGLAMALLAVTYVRFSFAERQLSRRKSRALQRRSTPEHPSDISTVAATLRLLPPPHFDASTAIAQFFARTRAEGRYILKSFPFWVLLLIALAFTIPILLSRDTVFGAPAYPSTAAFINNIGTTFGFFLVVIAAYYAGELVWRERERKIDEIIDATPMPTWALMLPKFVGLGLVLLATLAIAMIAGIALQSMDGTTSPAIGEYLADLMLPVGADALIVAALAIFVQALSPSKYLGWGLMVVYILATIFGPAAGLEHPLLIFGRTPEAGLNIMSGHGFFWSAAWWLRLFWATCAVLLLLIAQLLWPRGNEGRLTPRLRALPGKLRGSTGALAAGIVAVILLSVGWIVYNTTFLNEFRTSEDSLAYWAEYEKRYLAFADLPQPVVDHVELKVDLYPQVLRADVRGEYSMINRTDRTIDQVHVRLGNRKLDLQELRFPGARLVRDDAAFGYRIYRLETPMQPGDVRTLSFRARREQRGFRVSDPEVGFTSDGAELNAFDLTPRIGMHDAGLVSDPAIRTKFGLPEAARLPRLEDRAANEVELSDNAWITSDITVSTTADQRPVAPGRLVSERVDGGRRVARFVSDTPIQSEFGILSGRYQVKKRHSAGVDFAIFYQPGHASNVERMMHATETSLAYYEQAFGPYQFDEFRIVQVAGRDGGHAYPGMIAVGANGFDLDLRHPDSIDMVSVFIAHELSHQWWGHQVRPTRMQGAGVLVETLAQYSSLVVLEKLHGRDQVRRLLDLQRNRYLTGRRTTIGGETPLVRAAIEDAHIVYGKGAIAMWILKERMGEEAVNRALRSLIARFRFSTPPYPRSLDLVAALREQAQMPEDQALITDLFERITLYDLRISKLSAVIRTDGKWDVTAQVYARKFYADAQGEEREAAFNDSVEFGVFADDPDSADWNGQNTPRLDRRTIRTGLQTVRLVTPTRPAFVFVDPYGLYIERDRQDNVAAVAGR